MKKENPSLRHETSSDDAASPRNTGDGFYHRLSQLHKASSGGYQVEENFWLNRRPLEQYLQQQIYCYAYGECVWKQGVSIDYANFNRAWSFEYITKGNALITNQEKIYHAKAGTLFIHSPGQLLRIKADSQAGLSKRVILISGGIADYLGNISKLGILPFLDLKDNPRVTTIYDRVRSLVMSGGGPFLADDMAACCYTLILELGREANWLRYPEALGQVIAFIEYNLHTKITLPLLADKCHISISTLNKLFHGHLDISPINYIIRRRLDRALHLIGLGGLSLKEVAVQCGYEREAFFSRSFRQKFGVSPSDYKKFLVSKTSLEWLPTAVKPPTETASQKIPRKKQPKPRKKLRHQ